MHLLLILGTVLNNKLPQRTMLFFKNIILVQENPLFVKFLNIFFNSYESEM